MSQEALHRCCNTCKHKVSKKISYYGCLKAASCYNGFSAYEPNSVMALQESESGTATTCRD